MTVETGYEIGDKVTMHGYHDPAHIFYGIVAEIVDFRQFQNGSNDDWYWCARLSYEFIGEPSGGWYPVRFLSRYRGPRLPDGKPTALDGGRDG